MNLPPQVIVGAKLPLRPMHVWAIRVRLQIERRFRDLALSTSRRLCQLRVETRHSAVRQSGVLRQIIGDLVPRRFRSDEDVH